MLGVIYSIRADMRFDQAHPLGLLGATEQIKPQGRTRFSAPVFDN